MFFVIVCDDEQSKERLRLGEAEELYAHFRPTRVCSWASKPNDCNFHITSLHLPLADPIISHRTKVQNRAWMVWLGDPIPRG